MYTFYKVFVRTSEIAACIERYMHSIVDKGWIKNQARIIFHIHFPMTAPSSMIDSRCRHPPCCALDFELVHNRQLIVYCLFLLSISSHASQFNKARASSMIEVISNRACERFSVDAEDEIEDGIKVVGIIPCPSFRRKCSLAEVNRPVVSASAIVILHCSELGMMEKVSFDCIALYLNRFQSI